MTYTAPPGIPAAELTLRWFNDLPDFVKAADAVNGWTLLRFLRLLGDQADALEQLYERIDYTPLDEGGPAGDTSDLVDPDTADAAWLPWLAQLAGVKLDPELTVGEQRAAIAAGASGWRRGTKTAVAAAARTALTGTKYATVHDHAIGYDPAGQWDVTIRTRGSQTPDPAAVIAAIKAQGAKPAGVRLHHYPYIASVGTLQAAYPTVGHYAGLTVAQVVETGAV